MPEGVAAVVIFGISTPLRNNTPEIQKIETRLLDNNMCCEDYPDSLSVLVEKGKYGLQEEIIAIYLVQKSRTGWLENKERMLNLNILSDCVSVEHNFSGKTYFWSEMNRKFGIREINTISNVKRSHVLNYWHII